MRSDRGVGLIELLVVMSLLTLALSMFGMAFSAMLRTSDASRDIGAVTDQARLALNELDRQIRFGYWVKAATVTGCTTTCPAIKVLTTDSAGVRQCWVWAIDAGNGRLLTYHYPASTSRPVPSLATFGNPGHGGWHVAAGPEGEASDEVVIDPSSQLGIVATSLVKPLDPTTFERASYYLSAYATIVILKPDRTPVTIDFDMSVRNQWVGAQYASECG
jgi:type II secretory pathway pseudopilin PulG